MLEFCQRLEWGANNSFESEEIKKLTKEEKEILKFKVKIRTVF